MAGGIPLTPLVVSTIVEPFSVEYDIPLIC